MQRWLMRLPIWGEVLRDWQAHRALKPGTKRIALLMIAVVVTITVAWGRISSLGLAMLFVLASVGIFVVWRLPILEVRTALTCQNKRSEGRLWSLPALGRGKKVRQS
jgi:hypothetical protein